MLRGSIFECGLDSAAPAGARLHSFAAPLGRRTVEALESVLDRDTDDAVGTLRHNGGRPGIAAIPQEDEHGLLVAPWEPAMIRIMRGCALLLTLVVPIGPIALVHCGGRSVLIEPAPNSEPEPAPSGDAGPETDTGLSTDGPAHPDTGPTKKDTGVVCPPASAVNPGVACSVSGLKCASNMLNYDCNGQPTNAVACTCGQGMWSCVQVMPDCPPPPTCPAPSMVVAGGSCTAGAGLTCQSDWPISGCPAAILVVPCQCPQGQWVCKTPTPPLCMDASMPPETCPDPSMLVEGTPCTSNGLTCKGNPTLCGGATFYDAFQCDGSKFVTIAATVCGIDGGADASVD